MNLIILVAIVAFISGTLTGLYFGYGWAKKDKEEKDAKVAKMTWSETLRKYQESAKK